MADTKMALVPSGMTGNCRAIGEVSELLLNIGTTGRKYIWAVVGESADEERITYICTYLFDIPHPLPTFISK